MKWNTVRLTNAGAYEVAAADVVVVVDEPEGVVIVTLPPAGQHDDRQIFVKRALSDYAVVIAVSDGDPIDGHTTIILDIDHAAAHLGSDGVAWRIIS